MVENEQPIPIEPSFWPAHDAYAAGIAEIETFYRTPAASPQPPAEKHEDDRLHAPEQHVSAESEIPAAQGPLTDVYQENIVLPDEVAAAVFEPQEGLRVEDYVDEFAGLLDDIDEVTSDPREQLNPAIRDTAAHDPAATAQTPLDTGLPPDDSLSAVASLGTVSDIIVALPKSARADSPIMSAVEVDIQAKPKKSPAGLRSSPLAEQEEPASQANDPHDHRQQTSTLQAARQTTATASKTPDTSLLTVRSMPDMAMMTPQVSIPDASPSTGKRSLLSEMRAEEALTEAQVDDAPLHFDSHASSANILSMMLQPDEPCEVGAPDDVAELVRNAMQKHLDGGDASVPEQNSDIDALASLDGAGEAEGEEVQAKDAKTKEAAVSEKEGRPESQELIDVVLLPALDDREVTKRRRKSDSPASLHAPATKKRMVSELVEPASNAQPGSEDDIAAPMESKRTIRQTKERANEAQMSEAKSTARKASPPAEQDASLSSLTDVTSSSPTMLQVRASTDDDLSPAQSKGPSRSASALKSDLKRLVSNVLGNRLSPKGKTRMQTRAIVAEEAKPSAAAKDRHRGK